MLKREINFYKYRAIAYTISILFIIMSIFFTIIKGVNFGIDFKGGALFQIRTYNHQIADVRKAFADSDFDSFQVQTIGSEGIDYSVKLKLSGEMSGMHNIEGVKHLVSQALGGNIEFRRTDFVGPKIGAELVRKSIVAVILSLFGILTYVGFRFNFAMSVAAITALIHDVIAIFCFYAVTQLEFNTNSIAVMLIILGYSINDTVVIFDRIRENKRKFNYKSEIDLLNASVNQTLRRTMITSFTTLVVTLSLAIFGGESLKGFSYALSFGVIIGTYSTIFIASSVYSILHSKIARR